MSTSDADDEIGLPGLGRRGLRRGVAEDAVADARVARVHAPFLHERLALRQLKFLPRPVDPAAADAETVRRGQHIADDQTAVLHPCAHARVREDDADGRRAVERVQVRIADCYTIKRIRISIRGRL